MFEVLEFVFESFWRWLGTVILILTIGKTLRDWWVTFKNWFSVGWLRRQKR